MPALLRGCILLGVLAGLHLAGPSPVEAQHAGPRWDRSFVRFATWQAPLPTRVVAGARIGSLDEARPNRTRRVLIGGAIGAAAAAVACTAVSTLANDSADGGLSFCPLDTYLLVGGAGFVAGAAVGWLF